MTTATRSIDSFDGPSVRLPAAPLGAGAEPETPGGAPGARRAAPSPAPASRLEPDILGFHATRDARHADHGSRRLLLALLEDALRLLSRRGDAGREALRWFESEEASWGSFRYVCEVVGLESIEEVRAFARAVAGRRIPVARFHRRVRYRARATVG